MYTAISFHVLRSHVVSSAGGASQRPLLCSCQSAPIKIASLMARANSVFQKIWHFWQHALLFYKSCVTRIVDQSIGRAECCGVNRIYSVISSFVTTFTNEVLQNVFRKWNISFRILVCWEMTRKSNWKITSGYNMLSIVVCFLSKAKIKKAWVLSRTIFKQMKLHKAFSFYLFRSFLPQQLNGIPLKTNHFRTFRCSRQITSNPRLSITRTEFSEKSHGGGAANISSVRALATPQ